MDAQSLCSRRSARYGKGPVLNLAFVVNLRSYFTHEAARSPTEFEPELNAGAHDSLRCIALGMSSDQIAAARARLTTLHREISNSIAESSRLKEELRRVEDAEEGDCSDERPVAASSTSLSRDVASVLKLVRALELRNQQSAAWRRQNSDMLRDVVPSFQAVAQESKATLESLELARAEHEATLLELQRQQNELASANVVNNLGPTSRAIIQAVQASVQSENGSDHPLSLSRFASALRSDSRVAELLQTDTAAAKESCLEAIEALDRALGSPEVVSHGVLMDLLFSPEAETEKMLAGMQKGPSRPSWTLDHKWQNKAMDTLEGALQKKIRDYRATEAVLTAELNEVRAKLAARDADEEEEMALSAAFSAAQREKNAIKQEQRIQLDLNKKLRKASPTSVVEGLNAALGLDMTTTSCCEAPGELV